jgi:hypothetical protein
MNALRISRMQKSKRLYKSRYKHAPKPRREILARSSRLTPIIRKNDKEQAMARPQSEVASEY